MTTLYAILGNPTHSGELHVLTRLDGLGAETQPTSRELPSDALLFDDFQEAAQAWQRCAWFDDRYFPWVSPFIAAIEDGRIKAALINSDVLEDAKRDDTWMADVLDPIGVPIEAVRDHGGQE